MILGTLGIHHFRSSVLESAYIWFICFLLPEGVQKMTRKSPYKELLKLQDLNVFPEGLKVRKEFPAFPSWSLCFVDTCSKR